MEISFKIEGLDRIAHKGLEVQRAVDAELKKALYASGKRVETEAKRSILDGKKSGRLYRRRTVTHQASAPGEAPASDTGRLASSINTSLNGHQAVVIAGRGIARYAAWLEFGTRHIAARPFMFPALEKSKAWIKERLAEAVRRGTR
jgi:HK97 gp10 family phage protein